MIRKVTNSEKHGNDHISILFPGNAIDHSDTGIGSIGRIDQARILGGTTIKMYPHINDEILSYFRIGHVMHTDSEQNSEVISRKKLMLMKAGKLFYHQEHMLDQLEGLQIFIRPQTKDYTPEVIFYDLENENSLNTWRFLASNNAKTKIQFTSETEIYDIQIDNNEIYKIPVSELKNTTSILYVFHGSIIVNNEFSLIKGECIIFDENQISFNTNSTAELVLFVTNKNQVCFKDGMFSGNQKI